MQGLRVRSIQSKLKLLIATTSAIALIVAGIAVLAQAFFLAREAKIQQLYALGDVVASNSTATLMFNESAAAEELLASLQNQPTIEYACLVTTDGQTLAHYTRQGTEYHPELPTRLGHQVANGGYLDVRLPVREDGVVLGSLFLHASTADLRQQMARNAAMVLGAIATALILSILVASRLQRVVSGPILRLATTAQRISSAGDYSIRAQSRSDDEIGLLYGEFNRMLDRIQEGESRLRQAHDELEMRVQERTEQVSRANAELVDHMAQRERAAQLLEDSNRTIQLLQNITVAANEAQDVDTAILRALEHICSFVGWPVGLAYRWQTETSPRLVPTQLRFVARGLEGVEDAIEGIESVGPRTVAAAAVKTGRPSYAEDLVRQPQAVAYSCAGQPVASVVALPIRVEGDVVAVLEFLSLRPGKPDQRVLGAARHVGHQLGRVFERQRAEAERERLHRQLLDTSHRAGKAEIATGVLHNVGNVLNSVNVSAHLVADTLKSSKLASLDRMNHLLDQHADDLAAFLESDERGRRLPAYLKKLTEALEGERHGAFEETQTLIEHLQHIKAIVATQQSYAGVAGVVEPVCLDKLIGDAEKLTAASFDKHRIEFVHDFGEVPEIMIEKQKVLQIVVNLIKNAGDSVVEHRDEDRRVRLTATRTDPDRLRIEVSDNGMGIAPENLTRIFSHGFTTKPKGHGFGLHVSANAAAEMDGSLSASSPGYGQGATVTLELPFVPAGELAVN